MNLRWPPFECRRRKERKHANSNIVEVQIAILPSSFSCNRLMNVALAVVQKITPAHGFKSGLFYLAWHRSCRTEYLKNNVNYNAIKIIRIKIQASEIKKTNAQYEYISRRRVNVRMKSDFTRRTSVRTIIWSSDNGLQWWNMQAVSNPYFQYRSE